MYKITLLLGNPASGKSSEARKISEGRKAAWYLSDQGLDVLMDINRLDEQTEVLVIDEVPFKRLIEFIRASRNAVEIMNLVKGTAPEIVICSQAINKVEAV